MPEENRINADKGTPDFIAPKTKTEAEFPAVGNEPKTKSEHGVVPDGKGGAVKADK